MTDNEGFLTIYGHSDNLLNNNTGYIPRSFTQFANELRDHKHRKIVKLNETYLS